MKIGTVDNTNFNGRFRYNELLETAMANADAYDLEDFLRLLKNMEYKKDGNEFCISVVSYPVCGGDFLALLKNGKICGNRFLQPWNEEGKKIRSLILRTVNSMLHGRYPDPPRTRQPREVLLKSIYEKLDVNV